ncbi:MAG: ABC transporter ATP-binding protein, partial [Undibacterium sp.]|nr:ABC transporter ATP-binding protein [Undibacterium sp.]
RTFLDNVVTQVIASEGAGEWKEYIGGYTDWENYKNSVAASTKSTAQSNKSENKTISPVSSMSANAGVSKQKKLSYKEQKELDELPSLIAKLEAEQKTISEKLADGGFYKDAKPADIKKLNDRFAEIDELLLAALEKWDAMGS